MSNLDTHSKNALAVKNQHWTADADAFSHKVAFDFIAQVEKVMDERGLSRAELAKRLGVTQSSISQVLNNPQNLTLKTVAKYSQSLNLKVALVAYKDHDPENVNGLISPEVFRTCWEEMGKPADLWTLEESDHLRASTANIYHIAVDLNILICAIAAVPAKTFAPFYAGQYVTASSWTNPQSTFQICLPSVPAQSKEVTQHG